MLHARLFINNQDVPSSDGNTFECLNPIDGAVVTQAAAATPESAITAVNAAAAAFGEWSRMLPQQRSLLLNRAADLIIARTEEFSRAMTAETGATAAWGSFNCQLAASIFREAAALVTQIQGELPPSNRPGVIEMVIRQPAGVVLAFAPWNAPVLLAARAVAVPLACGNTVVLKGSELCPYTHRLIGEVLAEAGLPAGVLNVVLNAPADAAGVVEALIRHPAVRRVNFTGSTRVGRSIAEVAARHLKRCLLGMGGKAPMLILDDADLDEAVKAAAFGAFFNQGQICMSTERIIVDERIADEFVRRLTEKALSLKAGLPGEKGCMLGSMISAGAASRVQAMVQDAIDKGAELMAGGHTRGSVMEATVVDHVTPAMRLYAEESFGPVVATLRYHDVEEAISLANDSEYGLSAAVFGRDVMRALEVAKRIESGICHINGATVQDQAQVPFGGLKNSGYGRFGGRGAIDEFTELRWISIQTQPQQYPI